MINNNISKPLTLVKEEFLNNLVVLCNNSELPFFIIEGVLKDLLQDIHVASQKQFEADKINYTKMLKEQQSEPAVE